MAILGVADVTLESIYLKGPKGKISLDVGTKFMNINADDKNVYKVYNNGDNYFIRRDDGGENGDDIHLNSTTAPDGVMMLYHIPDDIAEQREALIQAKAEAFKKSHPREYYNPTFNIPQTNGYDGVSRPSAKNGENIDLTSRD